MVVQTPIRGWCDENSVSYVIIIYKPTSDALITF